MRPTSVAASLSGTGRAPTIPTSGWSPQEAHHPLDDVGRRVEIGAAHDDHVGARVAHLEVRVDRGDLALAPLLHVDVHPGPPPPDLARELGGVVGAAARDDDDLDDASEPRLLLEERRQQAPDVRGLVVGRDDDRNVHVLPIDFAAAAPGRSAGPHHVQDPPDDTRKIPEQAIEQAHRQARRRRQTGEAEEEDVRRVGRTPAARQRRDRPDDERHRRADVHPLFAPGGRRRAQRHDQPADDRELRRREQQAPADGPCDGARGAGIADVREDRRRDGLDGRHLPKSFMRTEPRPPRRATIPSEDSDRNRGENREKTPSVEPHGLARDRETQGTARPRR